MNYAYTPAFDFNPKETDMTFEEIVALLKDSTLTDYQRAANIHAALTKATQPSALTIKPKTERKRPKTRAATKWAIENGIPAPQPNGHLDLTPHEEAAVSWSSVSVLRRL